MANTTIEISVKGKWVAVPALDVNGTIIVRKGRWLKLAVVKDEEWLENETGNPAECIDRLKSRASGWPGADVFTFTQKLPATVPRFSYALEWDSVAAVHISSFEDWWRGLPQETRKNVRRSERRGVVIREAAFDDELIRGIVGVNNDSPVRQGRAYTHYGKTAEQVERDHCGFLDRSEFIGAYCGAELIGFLKLVYRADIASILQVTTKASHFDKRPANALIAKAVEACARKGLSHLTYGQFNYGNKGNTAVRKFKERNGFAEVRVPRYYVPLTTWGALAMKAGLHRDLMQILPGPVTRGAGAIRAKYYEVSRWMSRCSSTGEHPNRNRKMECSNPPAGSS